MPGVDVAYRDYTWSMFARCNNYKWSTFAAAQLFAMALPQKRKKSYDMDFKLKAVEVAEKKSKEAAACEFCINPNWQVNSTGSVAFLLSVASRSC